MKRSTGPGDMAGPSQERLSDETEKNNINQSRNWESIGFSGIEDCDMMSHTAFVQSTCTTNPMENASLKKELQKNSEMLAEQKELYWEELGMPKIMIAEEEKEREVMELQFLEKKELIKELTKLHYEKEKICENIANRLEREFKCSICLETLIQASFLPWCGHKFCNYCVTMWLKERANCPLCKGVAFSPIPCTSLDEIIDGMINDLGHEAKEKRRKALQDREETILSIGPLDTSSEELEGESLESEGESVLSEGDSMMSEGESMETMMSEEEGRSPEHSGRVREGPLATLTDSSSEGSSSDGLEGGPSPTEQDESTSYLLTLPSELALSSSSSSEDETTLS